MAMPEPRHRFTDFGSRFARSSEDDVTICERCGVGRDFYRHMGLKVVDSVLIRRVDLSIT